jgi:hypothetical protein
MYAVMGRSVRLHLQTGTVQVTAVGMFAGGGGFAIAPPTLASLLVVVGGLSERAHVIDDHIVVRDVLDLTVTIDHNIVDGAPATRFGAELRSVLESAAALAPAPPPQCIVQLPARSMNRLIRKHRRDGRSQPGNSSMAGESGMGMRRAGDGSAIWKESTFHPVGRRAHIDLRSGPTTLTERDLD